ncbi:MAG: flagellin [Candidatus Melainabacteria bacterium]
MPLTINTNTSSLNAQRLLGINTNMLNRSMEKLASGYRINRAGDDAAGLMISETLRAQIRGSQKALDNTQDGINVLNIADGAMQTITDNIQRIRELTVQAANDTYATAQRSAIAVEIDALRADIDRIANSVEFNGTSLLAAAGVPANFNIQVGPNNVAANDTIDVITALGDTTTGAAGLNLTAASVATNAAANVYLGVIDTSLAALNTQRATLGSFSNRLESAAANLGISIENLSSSESRIRNVDIASESAKMTQSQILQQASATILSQANQAPGLALKLLGG